MGVDKAKPAYVEDEDDTTGSAVRDSRRSAHVKPIKVSYEEKDRDRERDRVKDKDRDKRRSKHRKSYGDAIYAAEPSSRPAQHVEIISDRDAKLERRKSSSSSMKSPRKSGRPPSSHENRPLQKSTVPNSSRVDPTNYGIPVASSHAIPLAIRPRAQTSQTYPRPLSYHAATPSGLHGPPLSSSAYYPQYPVITPSYPPPSPGSSYMNYAAPPAYNHPRPIPPPPQTQYASSYQYAVPPQYPQPSQPSYTMSAHPQYTMTQAQPQSDYFAPKASSRPLQPTRTLSERFGGGEIPRSQTAFEPASISRTSSGFGNRDTRSPRVYSDRNISYHGDEYGSAAEMIPSRKVERTIRAPASSPLSKADLDARAMPPPRRPSILRRNSVYNNEPISDPGDYYERDSRSEYRDESRSRRPSTKRNSVSYDLGDVRIEAANSGRRRKSSYEEPLSAGLSDGYEAKMHKASQYQGDSYEAKLTQASSYQEDVAGGPTDNLTAETLRRQQRQRKQGGSSRSTKSSASRDESDYRKSATTRTTRSGSGDNDENVTLKVTGQTRVVVGGMQIDCADGGEISIQRQKSLRNGSERSSSEYGGGRIEDRHSRVSRPSERSRVSSHSGDSWTRTPQYPRDSNYI